MIHAALTTYDRESFLAITASSFALIAPSPEWELHVYDDASPTLTVERIKALFPQAVNVSRRRENLGADKNMRAVMIDFLESNGSHLLLLDGDLLLNCDCFNRATDVLRHDVSVLSLYNSALHVTLGTTIVGTEVLAIKRDLGGAGTIFARCVVEEIVANVPPSSTYDWDWSRYLTRCKITLHALRDSAVQHIGLSGTNSSNGSVDFGLGFMPDSRYNLTQCLDFMERLLQQKSVANMTQQQRIEFLESRPEAYLRKYAKRPWQIPIKLFLLGFQSIRRRETQDDFAGASDVSPGVACPAVKGMQVSTRGTQFSDE